MTLPPIIERELRLALRRQDPRRRRKIINLVCLIASVLLLGIHMLSGSRDFVTMLHLGLCAAGLHFAYSATLPLTSGLFTQERSTDTLGFLFLAGMSWPELFASKLLGVVLIAGHDLIALAPYLTLPFLTGGLSMSLFAATLCYLPLVLLFTLALGTLASVLCEEESGALLTANVIISVLCSLTPGLYWVGGLFGTPISDQWLLLSPAYGGWLIYTGRDSVLSSAFWTSCVVTLGWSVLALIVAGVVLQRNWRQDPDRRGLGLWFQRWREWAGPSRRARKRRAWLDINPFVWLALRCGQPKILAWITVGVLTALWLLCWRLFAKNWLSPSNFFATAVVLNLVVEWFASWASAKRIGDDRRSQALELVLVTPLPVADIVEGQLQALEVQFRPLCRLVFAMNCSLLIGGFYVRDWNWRGLCVYLIAWAFLLGWSLRPFFRKHLNVFWMSLNCGRPGYAVRQATGLGGWTWIWQLYWISKIFGGNSYLARFPSGSELEFIMTIIIVTTSVVVRAVFAFYAKDVKSKTDEVKERVIAEFREVAAEPVPDIHHPGFKTWNPSERFPTYRTDPFAPSS